MDWWAVKNMSECMGGWAGSHEGAGKNKKKTERRRQRERKERMRNPCFYPAFLPSCLAKQSAGAALHIHHCYSQWGECPSQGCSACVWARLGTWVSRCVCEHARLHTHSRYERLYISLQVPPFFHRTARSTGAWLRGKGALQQNGQRTSFHYYYYCSILTGLVFISITYDCK